MSEEFTDLPLVTFKTLKNTELGALTVEKTEDGGVVLRDVLKKVTESMLTSYPPTWLGKWTPNRAALRYSKEEIAGREFKAFEGGKALDEAGLFSLAK
ncbi:MAG: hypothetical protein AB8G23_13440 [Myxococcota bacterium]